MDRYYIALDFLPVTLTMPGIPIVDGAVAVVASLFTDSQQIRDGIY